MAEKTFKVTDPQGIHARPATLLVNSVSKFSSNVSLTCNGKTINLKSILGIMSLGVKQGDEITLTIEGDDANEALASFEETLKTQKIGE